MLSEKMQKAINDQINAEMWSSYLYLSMSAYFENEGLTGFASWMRVQAEEENMHAMKFFDYVNGRSGRVKLQPIAEVQTEWKDTLDAFKDTLEHEQKVTGMINNLMSIAIDEKDFATQSFLKWFIDEQVEEEATVNEILDQLNLVNASGHGLFMIDKDMKGRSLPASGAE
ncbi:MAG: ferritin [Salinivirgaceae bacterium]|jgi:ferritin|nr:ferritin [Salinivirgaceae bacterium]